MIQLNSEQQSALNAMMAGHNVFLTGEAGTGKSTVLREFRRQCNRACAFIAEDYKSQGWITRSQLEEVSHRIQKYHAQWEGRV